MTKDVQRHYVEQNAENIIRQLKGAERRLRELMYPVVCEKRYTDEVMYCGVVCLVGTENINMR